MRDKNSLTNREPPKQLNIETSAARPDIDRISMLSEFGNIAPPIHLSTSFKRDADCSDLSAYSYSTFDNPNRHWLEETIRNLESGKAAVATGSGMAAIAAVLSWLKRGDRLIAAHDLFQGTARLLNDQFRSWGIETDFVDTTDLNEVASAIRSETRMIWLDSPSNPMLRVSDIAAVSELAKTRGIRVVVDGTFAPFLIQKSLDLGADATIYAATKYIAGHSDVVSGLAVFREADELYQKARAFQINVGAVPSPMDCWLVERGLRTLAVRFARQCDTALAVARFLEKHDSVEAVYYPGLENNPDYELACRQMNNRFGGMVSFLVNEGRIAASKIVESTKLFLNATSLGGVESLIELRAASPVQNLGQGTGFNVPENLIRLSIGLEHPFDLIADLEQALSQLGN